MDMPLLEQVKILAQVLVPLVRTLQAELGEARANDLIRNALGEPYRRYGERWWRAQGERGLGEKMAAAFDGFAAGGAQDYEVLNEAADAYDVNVTGCRYARFCQQIGAPEPGFLLVCSADFALAEGYGGEVQLDRTQTIMQGASHCDFRYRLEGSGNPTGGNLMRALQCTGDWPIYGRHRPGAQETADERYRRQARYHRQA